MTRQKKDLKCSLRLYTDQAKHKIDARLDWDLRKASLRPSGHLKVVVVLLKMFSDHFYYVACVSYPAEEARAIREYCFHEGVPWSAALLRKVSETCTYMAGLVVSQEAMHTHTHAHTDTPKKT